MFGPNAQFPGGRYDVTFEFYAEPSGMGSRLNLSVYDSTADSELEAAEMNWYVPGGWTSYTLHDVAVPAGCHLLQFRVYHVSGSYAQLRRTTAMLLGDAQL